MNRRYAINALSLATLAGLLRTAGAAQHEHHMHAAQAGAQGPACGRYQALVAAAADCVVKGQSCLAHCMRLLSSGDKSLAACAEKVSQVLPLCTALQGLGAQESPLTPRLAKVALDACTECAEACKPHVEHHVECKACYDACMDCIKQCQAAA